MALTLESEQKICKVDLDDFFEDHKEAWLKAAQESYAFLRKQFSEESQIRPDDVAKVLKPLVEVNEDLQRELSQNKLI